MDLDTAGMERDGPDAVTVPAEVGGASASETALAGVCRGDSTATRERWPTPRCCRTHALEHRGFVSGVSGGPPLAPEEAADLEALHNASSGDAWLVLVGGEHGGIMREDPKRTRPGPFLAGHCSMQWVGKAYDRLINFFGRERTIVIAQLAETLSWLREASASEDAAQRLAGRSSLLQMLRTRLAEIEHDCARLISEGGADYDGAEVNAATVLRVLRGDIRSGGRVVPQSGVGSIVVIFISHGHAHPAGVGLKHHEWYLHFPHPVPDEEDHLYDVVSHSGFDNVDPHPEWNWGAPKYRWKLYSQMLFQAYHEVLQRAPRRRLVLFHQFCLSGGVANFMRHASYQAYCGTSRWPVFVMTTAGRFEPSLGNFVDFWTREFVGALLEGERRTLGDVYTAAEKAYWEANPDLLALNESMEAARGSKALELGEDADESAPTTVGTVSREAGWDWGFGLSMDEVPVGVVVNLQKHQSKMTAASA
mmetsp:Transcript_90052/g.156040  ORF Transcript_90052/g.156040 Transcript_90052/m.156040 type:complete len:478 (-) Transcript_90052:53-1486(-)